MAGRRRVGLLGWLLVAMAAGVAAAPVGPTEATTVARHWLAANSAQVAAGRTVQATREFRDRGGALTAYIVDLAPEGYLVVPANDVVEPALCFSATGAFAGWAPAGENILADLLSQDIAARVAKAAPSRAGGRSSAYQEHVAQRWALLRGARTRAPGDALGAGVTVNAGPWLTTAWGQGDEQAPYTFDSATPNHYVCGCVATAMAQIMRFHRYPASAAVSGTIQVDGAARQASWSGAFDYSLLPNVVTNNSSAAVRAAVGNLTWACGIAVATAYHSQNDPDPKEQGSAAATADAAAAFVNTFGFASATWKAGTNWFWASTLRDELTAGYPVQMAIRERATDAGHSVVCDGWGTEGSDYRYHLNMGWDGAESSNTWYQVPDFPAGVCTWDVLTGYVYNIRSRARPTDVLLTPAKAADQPAGAVVGKLTSEDPNRFDTFTYALVAGAGSTDNASFTIAGDVLRTAAVLPLGGKSIRVRTTDQTGRSFEKALTVTVVTANQPPVNSVPSVQRTKQDTPLVFNTRYGNAISVADPDVGLFGKLKVSLLATNGVLTLSSTSGLTFVSGHGNATANPVFTGTLTSINNALAWLKFTPAASYTGLALVTITTDDQGNTGPGGAKTDTDTVVVYVGVTGSLGPDGGEMVLIPAGTFTMGSPVDVGRYDEHPQQQVNLSAYRIHKNLVTVAQYRRFCQATNRSLPPAPFFTQDDSHPVVKVSWHDANAYAQHYGMNLPTEAQWEKAARGSADARLYPWGDTWDAGKANNWEDVAPDVWTYTSPVGSFPAGASPYGVLDMAGNVWQWCQDWYRDDWYSVMPLSNPVNTTSTAGRVLRGWSWGSVTADTFRVAYRDWDWPDGWGTGIGFRCVAAP